METETKYSREEQFCIWVVMGPKHTRIQTAIALLELEDLGAVLTVKGSLSRNIDDHTVSMRGSVDSQKIYFSNSSYVAALFEIKP